MQSESPIEFVPFDKIPRISRACVITEKIDGTNAQIYIGEDGTFMTGSRTRWIYPDSKKTDNFGFSKWAHDNKDELMKLGPGRHYGEWWGQGIQRGYGLEERRFSLFNVGRWKDNHPSIVSLVPVLYEGDFGSDVVDHFLNMLRESGSQAAPGFMNPEGIVIYHTASRQLFKKTLDNDAVPKTLVKETV